MHRVNINNKKTVALRLAAYGVTIALSVVTTAVLLFVAMGYRFNSAGSVIQNGLLLVDNKPEAAQIYINNKLEDSQSPGRFVLPIGKYTLSLGLDGYREWKKQFVMAAEYVEQVQYPLLIPTKLTADPLLQIAQPESVSQSSDNKSLLYFVPGETVIHRIKLDPQQPTQSEVPLSGAFVRESGSVGSIKFVEWSLSNKAALIEQTLPSGKTFIISLIIDKPQEAVNITTMFSDVTPSDVHYIGKKTDSLYGLHEGVLRRYDLGNASTTKVLDRIVSYQPYGDKILSYTQISKDGNSVSVGITDQENTATLESFGDPSVRPLVSYGAYSDHNYFVVAVPQQGKARIYRDALKKPILNKQIPFVILSTPGVSYIKFSPNNQYIYLQSAQKFVTYDFENVRINNFAVAQPLGESHPAWVSNAHLAYQAQDSSINYLMEFDGNNNADMLSSDPGTRLYYSPNHTSLYRVITKDKKTSLDNVSLVAK